MLFQNIIYLYAVKQKPNKMKTKTETATINVLNGKTIIKSFEIKFASAKDLKRQYQTLRQSYSDNDVTASTKSFDMSYSHNYSQQLEMDLQDKQNPYAFWKKNKIDDFTFTYETAEEQLVRSTIGEPYDIVRVSVQQEDGIYDIPLKSREAFVEYLHSIISIYGKDAIKSIYQDKHCVEFDEIYE